MIVKNVTKNTIITKDLKIATSFSDKLFGLLIKKNPRSLLFKTRFGIHTFFLKQPIDLLVLNDKRKVVITKTVKPNRLAFYNPEHDTVIELPEGSAKKSKTEIGDKIAILNN